MSPSGQSVAVLGHRTDRTQPVLARWHGIEITLPDDSLSWHDYHKKLILYPIVRATGDELLTVVKRRASNDREINGWLWNGSGTVEAAFHAGDNVEEVLASDDLILLFYGDEGQTGDISLSREAMTVMSLSGETLWGHRTQFGGKGGFDTWFHAAVWEGRDEVAVFADVDHKCAFVRLQVRERRQEIWRPPLPIATPDALTTTRNEVILHGCGADTVGQDFLESFQAYPGVRELIASNVKREHIIDWLHGGTTWQVIGEWPWDITRHPTLRGLPGGRFIAPKPDGYTVLSFDY